MEKEIIKAKMIDTGNGCFIFAKERYGYDSPLKYLYFDGEQPKESYKKDWFYSPIVLPKSNGKAIRKESTLGGN